MAYSQLYIDHQKKIPTVLAVLIVCFILLFFVRIFFHPSVPSRAAKISLPRMEIANLSPNQVTIYWQSEVPEVGWIIYGENDQMLNTIVLDERDIQSKKNSYKNHFVILRNLKENKAYVFKIVSNNQLISKSVNTSFSFTTPKSDTSIRGREPAYGKIINPNNQPLENAIVILSVDKTYPMVTLTKGTGEWLIPLNIIYEKDTLKSRTLASDEKISIEIMDEDGQTSFITTDVTRVTPLPQTVIIGKNYNFLGSANVLGVSDTQGDGSKTKQDIDIIYPLKNAFIHGYQPLIKGIAIPNTDVIVMIQGSSNISMRTKTDNQGFWQVSLSNNLQPGEYTIVLLAKNKQNIEETIKRTFSIVPNDIQQVLGVATAEANLTPTVAPTAMPTYQQQPVATESATIKPPVSGTTQMMPLAGGVSLIIVGIGLLLVF